MTDVRPDPDLLLAATARPGRGHLTVFLGYAPGVGKTWAMLTEAHRRIAAGEDVLVGQVLTHGRAETEARLAGLPVLPTLGVDHQGIRVEAFDLAGALKRRPGLLLLDELPTSNPSGDYPGKRHAKRWQDVEELLTAGIPVFTACNIQHLESLADPVRALTGVAVHERVPDTVFTAGVTVTVIDCPPDELRERLRQGRIYQGTAADRALAGYFAEENLAGLRELALRFAADRVRAARPGSGGVTAPVLLVGVGPSPSSAGLVRHACRLAREANARWLAVHVQTASVLALDAPGRARLEANLRLAAELGGEVHFIPGEDPVVAFLAVARRQGATRLIVGRPVRQRWGQDLATALVSRAVGLEVLVVDGVVESAPPPAATGAPATSDPLAWWLGAGALLLITLVCAPLRGRLEPANLAMLFLLPVLVVASRGRHPPAVATAVLAVLLFDIGFVPPYGTLAVSDVQYLITFAVMLGTGFLVTSLAARVRARMDWALRQAETAGVLGRLGQGLAISRGQKALIAEAERRLGELLQSPVLVLPTDGPDSPRLSAAVVERLLVDPALAGEAAVAQWALDHRTPAGRGTDHLPGAMATHQPLVGATGPVGVLALIGAPADWLADPENRRLLASLATLVGLALECDRLAESAHEARVATAAERTRTALLGAVSHDLRTPLAAITGSASALASDDHGLDAAARRELALTLADQAQRLERQVANLLDLVRLESGAIRPRSTAVDLAEAIGAARALLRERLAGMPVSLDLPGDLPPVQADPALLHTLLLNLLDNAVKHAPGPLAIAVRAAADRVEFSLGDRGPGVPADERERIFRRFETGPGSRGAGLGLAVCRAIVDLLRGSIRVEDRAGGGALFLVVLPAAEP